MQTYKEMRDELAARLQVADNSTLYPSTRIQTLILNAHLWATGLLPWTMLERAKTAYTRVNADYYDYPSEFKTDGITRLYVNGLKFNKKSFRAFDDYRQSNPNDLSVRYFADYGRQIFIFPTPTVIVAYDVWGIIQAKQLSADADLTIFSKFDDQGNEAIVKKAYADAIKPRNASLAELEEKNAIGTLATVYKKIKDNQQEDQQINTPMYDIPDFFGGSGSNPGAFSYEPNK
jgi:hypothetical protein